MITLAHDLDTTHHDLHDRLDLASSARGDRRRPRDHYAAIDTFLAIASRHDAAMVDAIAPLVRHVPGGHDLAHDYLAASRRYEEALAQVKARLYGSIYAVDRPWPEIWADVHSSLDEVCALELRIAEALLADDDGTEDLGARLHHATSSSRPHDPTRGSRTREWPATSPGPWPAASTGSGTPRRAAWSPSPCVTTTAPTRGGSPSTCWRTPTSTRTRRSDGATEHSGDQRSTATMTTGPSTSSRTSRDAGSTPPITVGANHQPGRSSG